MILHIGIASIRWAGNKTAVANQDYHLHCPFAGYPILSITWHRGGQVGRIDSYISRLISFELELFDDLMTDNQGDGQVQNV